MTKLIVFHAPPSALRYFFSLNYTMLRHLWSTEHLELPYHLHWRPQKLQLWGRCYLLQLQSRKRPTQGFWDYFSDAFANQLLLSPFILLVLHYPLRHLHQHKHFNYLGPSFFSISFQAPFHDRRGHTTKSCTFSFVPALPPGLRSSSVPSASSCWRGHSEGEENHLCSTSHNCNDQILAQQALPNSLASNLFFVA